MDKKGDLDPRSVFVRGISYEIGDAELTEAFSAVGPVRHAFLVKDGSNRHKGYGFVQYALEEDAERAVQELHGTELGGRKLKIEGAKKRATLDERKGKRKQKSEEDVDDEHQEEEEAVVVAEEEKQPALKKPRSAATAPVARGKKEKKVKNPEELALTSEKHALVRTVALGGLSTPASIDAAIAFAKEKSENKVEAVQRRAPEDLVKRLKLAQDGCSGEVVLVRYASVKDAMAAVAALHGQTINFNKKSKAQLWARQVSGEGLHLKRWRVVVRNLSFKSTEEDLRAAFAPAGFVWEVTAPVDGDGKPRGFAFIGFTCRAHAERGIKLVNGTKVAGRPVAVDWAVSKRDYELGAASGAAPDVVAGEQSDDDDGEGSVLSGLSDYDDDDSMDGDDDGRRVLGRELDDDAVELAPEEERGMLHSVIDDILGGGDDSEDVEEQDDEDSEEEIENEGNSDDDSEEEEEEEGDMFGHNKMKSNEPSAAVERLERRAEQMAAALEDAAAKKTAPPPPAGATVFVRGLTVDVTKDQLFTAMRAYGQIASVRLVIDKISGKTKGTAFVDFRTLPAAEAVVAACEKGRNNAGTGVLVAGRRVEVDLALDSDGARKLAVEKGVGPIGDRRNLYLSKEGLIPEGSEVWEALSVSDKAKRKRGVEDARTKLRSPNFCISKTRLNVRNVPRSWDEKKLKALFIAAVKERATQATPKVVQVKVLKEDGPDGVKGSGKSKGIAFVEFEDYEHSLCALRQLNNNPQPWGKKHRPIVEFAIDDVRTLKKREVRQAAMAAHSNNETAVKKDPEQKVEFEKMSKKMKKREAAKIAAAEEGGVEYSEKEKSRRKLRQERRRMLKERQRAAQGKQENAHVANGGAAAAQVATKSQRRRDQRKKKQDDGGGAGIAALAPTAVVKMPVKQALPSKSTQVQRKKERDDTLMDKLASDGVSEGRVVKKRRRDTDKVERLAEAYVARVYGGDGGKEKKQKQQDGVADGSEKKKRWFQDE